MVGNGDRVTVQVIASSIPGTTTIATLTIGGVSAEFSVTTSSSVALPPVTVKGSGGAIGWPFILGLGSLGLLRRRKTAARRGLA